MKTCGIIVEYNPFHNGHIRHIQASRKITSCDCLIAIMSGHFSQRGEIALQNGVDVVIELPTILTTQNGSVFGHSAVSLLEKLQVNDLVFGSETGNLPELKEIAALPINVEYLKEKLRQGNSYPKAYGLLADYIYPNDRLAISYLRALNHSTIKAHALRRDSDYNSETLTNGSCSAGAIRKAVQLEVDYHAATPMLLNHPVFLADLYGYLRRILLLEKREFLQERFLVSEGIEKLLHDQADKHSDFENFLNACISKRYTRSRIQRTILHIMLHNNKKEVSLLHEPHYLRVLGFTKQGQKYLREIKGNLNLVTRFKEIPPSYKIFEERAAQLYASMFAEERRRELLQKELQGPIILK